MTKHHHGMIYMKRVSFDNIANASPFFTLKRTSRGFKKKRSTRTYLVAVDLTKEITCGLDFTLTNLMDEFDELIFLGCYASTRSIFEISASQKAQEIMDWIIESHQGHKISITVELTYDRPDIALQKMIDMYNPSLLIVGTKSKKVNKNRFSGAGIFKTTMKKGKVPFVIVKDTCFIKEPSKKTQQHFSILSCFF